MYDIFKYNEILIFFFDVVSKGAIYPGTALPGHLVILLHIGLNVEPRDNSERVNTSLP